MVVSPESLPAQRVVLVVDDEPALVDVLRTYLQGEDISADAGVYNLRQKIEDKPARPRIVVTVVGVGYKPVDPTRVVSR